MNKSIVPQLIKNDFLMMQKTILIFALIMVAAVVGIGFLFGRIPNVVFLNIGITLLVAPAGTCGIVLLMKTIVMEKQKNTQLFIMSLPVSVKEFTSAKLLVNLPVFTLFWLLITAVGFYFSFGCDVFPIGTIPFVTMIFIGIFVAYLGILSVAMIYQSYTTTIIAILGFELGTPAYLWVVAYLEPISRHVYDSQMHWNSTAVGIVLTQIFVAAAMLYGTWRIQINKRDFI